MRLAIFLCAAFAGSALGVTCRAPPTCTPTNGAVDDTPAIAAAIKACPTSTIVIPQGETYNIGSQLQFTGCTGCTLQIDGELKVSVNFTYWDNRGEVFYVKNIANATVTSSTGTGVVDGQGQASWDYIVLNNTAYGRPYLWRIDGSTNFTMTNLLIKNAPSFHVVTSGSSTNVHYSNLTIYSVSNSSNVAHNTDGFDIGPASYVTVENVHVTNDDDCIALKPGASYVEARDITCVGSHGLSVGSLGNSHGSNDTVANCLFERANMTTSSKASGIKVYPAGPSHGSATVYNVTWKDIYVDKSQYALQIQSCYGETAAYCSEYPSTALISDVVWQNVSGVTDGSYKDVVGNLDCPGNGTCGISVSALTVTAPDGNQEVLCANTPSNIGVTCTPGASG